MFRRHRSGRRQHGANPSHRSCTDSPPLTDTQSLHAVRIESMQNKAEPSCAACRALLYAAREVQQSAAAQCHQRVLSQYRDVFPAALPPGLPPQRDVDHAIELTPGAVPPSRPTYRLSATELAELKKQLGY